MIVNWICLGVSTFMLVFISLTMLLRGNDYRKRRKGEIKWFVIVRMAGFTLAGFAPWGIVGWWMLVSRYPSIFMTMFLIGVSCVFLTSPNIPPWHKLLTEGSEGL